MHDVMRIDLRPGRWPSGHICIHYTILLYIICGLLAGPVVVFLRNLEVGEQLVHREQLCIHLYGQYGGQYGVNPGG